MARTLVRILLGATTVAAIEIGIILAGPWEGPALFSALRFLVAATGVLFLAGGGLALLGPNVDSTSEIRPMQGTWYLRERRLGSFGTGGPGAVLVSSGTRSLWDASRNPALREKPPIGHVGLGIGSLLCLFALTLSLL